MKQKSSTHSRIICYEQAPFLEIRVTDQSDRVYESHAHPTLSIGAMREWKTSFRTPKGEFLLEEETLVVIEPHLQHSCNPYQGQKRSYVMVFIAYEYGVELQKRLFDIQKEYLLGIDIFVDSTKRMTDRIDIFKDQFYDEILSKGEVIYVK